MLIVKIPCLLPAPIKIGKVEDFTWFPEVPEHAAAMVGGSVGRIPQPSFTSLTFLETAKKACFSDTEQKMSDSARGVN